jgi:predicted DNA-binding protein
METIKGHDLQRETKKDIIYVRMTDTMIKELKDIRTKTGIPVSEVVRESVKRLLQEVNEMGSLNIRVR